MLEKTEVFTDKGVDSEKIVAIAKLKLKDDDKAHERSDKCKDLYKGEKDCAAAYNILKCLKAE